MNQLLLVAAGGGLGSVLRFLAGQGIQASLGKAFPYGTLFVNVSGSFAIGVLFVVIMERAMLPPEWRAFLIVGVMGGYTTFSSFSLETVSLLARGDFLKAGLNVLLSVALCLAATGLGIAAMRQVSS